MATSFGNIDVTLRPDAAPKTVANFLGYVDRGAYDESIFHQLAPGVFLEGGGFFVKGDDLEPIPAGPTVPNEFQLSNVRGTIAMEKPAGNPNGAIDQFFFNLTDNSKTLDTSLGGFTVFGQVTDAASLAVMDQLAAQQVVNRGFPQLPVVGYSGTGPVLHQNFVTVNAIDTVLDPGTPDFSISAAPQQIELAGGGSGSATLTVTPMNGYTGTVKFACGPLPDFAACVFNPAELTFAAGSTAQMSTFTFVGASTSAVLATPAGSSGGSGFRAGPGSSIDSRSSTGIGLFFGFMAGLAGFSLLLMAACRSKLASRTALGMCGGLMLSAAGCGGSAKPTPPGTYNLTVRLSDGTVSHPSVFTVKIDSQPNAGNGG
jgi:cyclophilin family peptidyl-prolyl cis-trans isomerase